MPLSWGIDYIDEAAVVTREISLSKAEIVFFAQVFMIYIVLIACIVIVSISMGSESDVLTSASLSGAILPQPDMKK